MIKKIIYCNECGMDNLLFICRGDILKCPECGSENLKILYKPLHIKKDSEMVEVSVGELTQDYIDENKQVLDIMKKEKVEWKS